MSPAVTHVYEKMAGEEKDVDIFILEAPEQNGEDRSETLIIQKASPPPKKGNSVAQLCSSSYFVYEDDPVEQIVEELALLDGVFALGVVNQYREALGVIIRRELFDMVGRSYGKNFIQGKSARSVMKYVKSFAPGASIFSVGKTIQSEMEDNLISYFMIIDKYRRFAGTFSTKDMMLFYSRMVNNEMKLVQDIQRNVVEPTLSVHFDDNSRLYGLSRPAKEAGGDYYLIRELDEDRIFYCVADVSGKGYPASLITCVIGTLLESTTFSKGLCGSLMKLNRFLQHKFGELGLFATGLFVMYNRKTGESEVCDCGHQYFYLLRDRAINKVKSQSNPPLGLIPDMEPETYNIKTQRDDSLIIMTDGLVEQLDETGMEYPLKRLAKIVGTTQPEKLAQAVSDDIRDFRGFAPQHDDITLLVHRRESLS